MAGASLMDGQRQQLRPNDITRQWVRGIGLAALVGLAYFVAADFSVRLLVEPEGVAVFWPAAGISSGILIAFGLPTGWPALGGVVAATIATHLIIGDPLWAGVALGLCNGAEALVIAVLIHHYFGADFGLVRIRHVIGLVAAAVAGTILSGIGGAVVYRLLQGPSASMLSTWEHWFASNAVGIVAVAPLVIGLASVVRRPPPPSEIIEGLLALAALAVTTAFIISLPRELWETVFPIRW
jgi:integral membrane sensor domain MASE1